MFRGWLRKRAGAQPQSERRAVAALEAERNHPAHDHGRACGGGRQQERGADEHGLGKHNVSRVRGEYFHQRDVLGFGGTREDVFDIESDRLDALQPGTLREAFSKDLLVEVGLGG